MNDDIKKSLIERVRRGIAANRVPGLHFPGYFLGLHARGMDKSEAWTAIPYGPHCANTNGDMNIAAIALLADMGPGAAMRMHLPPASRMATATLQLQFTGIPVRSDLECHARFDGFFEGAAAVQGRTSGRLIADGKVVCHAVGTFATPPAPPGTKLVPVPWAAMEQLPPPLAVREMAVDEKSILKSARAALKSADAEVEVKRSFIEHLWAQIASPRTGGGAGNAVRIGPHIGNRVGHVQGGVMVGIAAASAVAALPQNARLTGASAWYISAGMGKSLRVRSRILQQGRTIAVVRTEVIGDNQRRVLELLTSHAF
jgi:acyl-coenzyme A thioesterase PaaI-like protein